MPPALQRKTAMRKMDLILNSVQMKDFDPEDNDHRRRRRNTRRCMIYPEDPFRMKWDLIITL